MRVIKRITISGQKLIDNEDRIVELWENGTYTVRLCDVDVIWDEVDRIDQSGYSENGYIRFSNGVARLLKTKEDAEIYLAYHGLKLDLEPMTEKEKRESDLARRERIPNLYGEEFNK